MRQSTVSWSRTIPSAAVEKDGCDRLLLLVVGIEMIQRKFDDEPRSAAGITRHMDVSMMPLHNAPAVILDQPPRQHIRGR